MSSKVGSIHYDLELNSDKFDKETKKVGKSITKLGDKARDVGKKMSLFVTAPLLLGFKKTVDASSELEESVNAVEVVFGDASDAILDFGKTASKTVGLSRRAVNQAAVPIGGMLKNMGFSAEEAAEKTLMLTQRAADMASVYDTEVLTVLDAMASGLRGQSEPLTAYSVSLLDNELKLHALAKGIIETDRQMTAAEKTTARLSLIMEQSAVAAGDFGNTADSLANKQRVLAAEAENVSATFGEKLQPIMDKLLTQLGRLLDWFNQLSPAQQDFALKLGLIAAATGPLLIGLSSVIKLMAVLKVGLLATTVAAKGMASFVGSSAMLNPWTALAAVAVGALLKIKAEANKTIQTLSDTERAVEGAAKADAFAIRKAQEFRAAGNHQAADNVLNSIRGRAIGGPITAGRDYLVGEKGPEIIRSSTGGTVIPNDKIGGGGATINLHMQGVMARSASDLRDLFNEGISLINQERISRGEQPV